MHILFLGSWLSLHDRRPRQDNCGGDAIYLFNTGFQLVMLFRLCAIIPNEGDDVVVVGGPTKVKAGIGRDFLDDPRKTSLAAIAEKFDFNNGTQRSNAQVCPRFLVAYRRKDFLRRLNQGRPAPEPPIINSARGIHFPRPIW